MDSERFTDRPPEERGIQADLPAAPPAPEPDEDAPSRARIRWFPAGAEVQIGCFGLLGTVFGTFVGSVTCPLSGVAGSVAGPLLGGALGGALFCLMVVSALRAKAGQGKRTRDAELPGPASPSAAQERKGSTLPTAGDPRVQAWRQSIQPSLPSLRRQAGRFGVGNCRVLSVAVSADGRLAVTASSRREVTLWDVDSGAPLRTFRDFEKRAGPVAISPDGVLVASAGVHEWGAKSRPHVSSVRVRDAASGEELRRVEKVERVFSMAFLPGGRSLLLGRERVVQVWDLEGPTLEMQLPLGTVWLSAEEVVAVCPSPDGCLALVGSQYGEDLRLVSLARSEELRTYKGHGRRFAWVRRGAVVAAAYSPGGDRAATGSYDRTARVWDLASGQEVCRYEGHVGWWGWRGVVGVAWLDDERVASASEDGTLQVWDARSGQTLARYEHGAMVLAMAATPDGRLVLTGGRDGVVRTWRV